SYEHSNPGGKNYVINEFRYADSAQEFVEIYGPAGAFPVGFQLRFINGADGAVYATVSLGGQSIPDDGGGFGFFVVGDPGVPNVDYSTGFSAATDNIQNGNPDAIQLYDSGTGCVYDSVVYEAWGGLADLIRRETLGVTQNGYPWCGDVATGTDASGNQYTFGRYPDGTNTHINFQDFSFMPASPGLPNGNSISSFPVTYNFETAPPKAFKTFQTFNVQNPDPAIGNSPSGGKVHRCVDTTGGGVISVFGDAALGANGNGYMVTGEIYIPSASEPAQAIALGICGRQGSAFFPADPSAFGYESGYWLIYENKSGVGLKDGRPDHPGVFEFVYATHDNMDAFPVELLGSRTLTELGVTAGSWTTFELKIDPNATSGNRLKAAINGVTVYLGNIPPDGPTSGAFQVGFRENHTGAPASNEGTWIDNITISLISPATPTPTLTPTPTPTFTPTPTPTPVTQFLLTNFEGYALNSEVMFRDPAWSGSTTGVNTATDAADVSNAQSNDILDPAVGSPGSRSYRFYWEWTTPGSGFVRATSYNAANKPNPIIDFTKGLSIYVKITKGEVDMTYWVRETGVSGNIGDNGGVSGTIEKCTRQVRLTASANWQYFWFDVPNEPYAAVTGNGVLNGQWGTLEALAFSAVPGSSATEIEIYVDDLYQGPPHNPLGPTPTPTSTPISTSTPTPTPTLTPTSTPTPTPTPTATSTPTPTPTPTPSSYEWRSFWVDAWHAGFKTAAEVTTMVNTAKNNNYNAVIVQIRRRGDAYYFPTAPNIEPRATDIATNFDALQEVINQAHAQGLEVHAWIPTYLIWSSTTPPTNPNHVYNARPEYLMKDYDGNMYIAEGYYLDPGNPDANKWNYNVVMDIVQRYDIDGFHFDYIRYPQQNSGYNDVAIARYNAEYGLSGKPAYTDAQFSAWRRRQITDWLRNTYVDIIA
ncbi:MAG: family 10 glycosylhydrolase, partial [Candidatus Sumerlaeia bacterium]|nr:family 10 glycosylhydrolase [Candidatus Sumerlaeia bacterium]